MLEVVPRWGKLSEVPSERHHGMYFEPGQLYEPTVSGIANPNTPAVAENDSSAERPFNSSIFRPPPPSEVEEVCSNASSTESLDFCRGREADHSGERVSHPLSRQKQAGTADEISPCHTHQEDI
jgi:hypothetical protein